METMKNASKEFFNTTKTIIAPIISYDKNHVTFSLKSLDTTDTILYVQLILSSFWTQNWLKFTSLQVETENDFFLNSSAKTSERDGTITFEMRNPERPYQVWQYRGRKLIIREDKVRFSLKVTARTMGNRAWASLVREITGPLVTVEPELIIVARSCLNSKNVMYHLAPFIESSRWITMGGNTYEQVHFKNTTDMQVLGSVSEVQNYIGVQQKSCWTKKEPHRLTYIERDRWNKKAVVSKWMCQTISHGRFATVIAEKLHCRGKGFEEFTDWILRG